MLGHAQGLLQRRIGRVKQNSKNLEKYRAFAATTHRLVVLYKVVSPSYVWSLTPLTSSIYDDISTKPLAIGVAT